ncbi:unnamed protein product [Aphis gossypii]|uniref:C2H2-type domain-containing protein n=1 Tax=Aphis gossypii TaxID=80765 RepID=A0A9P0IQX8_APHGO|nr:unnamed protein product [Aphis gossypii]
MGGADGPPPKDADRSSSNDGPVPEDDPNHFDKLLTHLRSFLPFLTKVIDSSELLEIQPDHVTKLQCLYELVDNKRLSPDRLKTCKKVFYDLYDSYSNLLNYYLPEDFKTSWMKETKLNDNEQEISSEVKYTFNKSIQNQNSKSEPSNNLSVPSTSNDNMENNQPDSLKDLTSNNENTIDKNVTMSESPSNQNVLYDTMSKKNDLPEFSDSRLRLNKIIGFAANASIEKLNKSDASVPHSELTTQIFNELINQNNSPVLYKDMLKDINMDDIDVNYVKEVIEGIKKASCVGPVQPPPLPPSDLMDLGASKINIISTAEPNSNEVVTHNTLLSKSTTINRAQSNTEMNKSHNASSSNDTRQKFISALKPGTLIDLENSKVSRTSLHIESLRPAIKANEKSNDIKTSVADIGVPRDPRIRKKSLLSSENSVNSIITHASLISNAQNTFSTNIPTIYTPNMDNSKATLFETRAQEMSGYNGPSPPNHPNSQMLNIPFYSEHNGGSSVQFQNRPLSQNQNRQNRNDFNQFGNSSQMHVIPSHCEPMVKYCEPVPFKVHSNDIVSKRDPRSLKNVPLINKIPFRNYKEYREAKYGKEQNKGLDKNKQMNQAFEKIEKNNTIDSSYNTFGIVNETANIKGFKIPKIKHNEDLIDYNTLKNSKSKMFGSSKNNVDVSKTEKNSIILKNTELKKSNGSKMDTINISHTEKDLEIQISENSNTDIDHKIKTIVNNNSDKDESCPEINPEEITVDIASEVNKDELDSKFEQNNMFVELNKPKRTKKPKKYSKEKEFEKIVKEAVQSSYDDVYGPRTRTRCSLLKKDKTLNTSNVNSPKPKFEKNDLSRNDKKLESGECSKKLDNVSIPNMQDVSEPIEIGHNIISSTSKEQSEVVNSTTTEILYKSRAENIVSSNEINSTADNNPKIDEKLINILKNPKFISLFQDENKMEKLNKLLESSDLNINEDKSKNKDILNEEQIDIDKQKKRKMKKEKRKRKKMKKNLSEESSNEESVNDISDDSNLNQAESIVITKNKNNNLNEFNQGNTNSINIPSHSSTDRHKLKSIKRKKSKESYGNFEILKDKCKPELKNLKIVLAKFDKSIKRSENCNSDISSTGIDIPTNNEPISIEKAHEIKPKKPFYGPLSVKLARQKMEIERKNSKNKQDHKNHIKLTKICDTTGELYSSLMIKQPIVLIRPCINLDEITSKKTVVQNSNISTVIEPNVTVSKPEFKKARLSELDKLHADISEMFDCEAVLNASNIRQCRTNKQIDYVNTNVVSSKKKKASNIEQLDSNNDQNKLICGTENPKNTKKKVKKSTLKLKNKKKGVKKSTAIKTLPPVVVKTAVLNITSNEQSDKLKKKRKGHKKFKKSNRNQLNNVINDSVLYDESELNNVSNNKISTEIIPRVLSEYEFKDKSYFQTADNILECKFCDYKDKGLNIVLHFKDKHSEEEVLPSRLPTNCAEPLILQSIKENFLYQDSQDIKPFCHLGPMNVNYTCVFCQVIFYDYFKFYDHLTGHTGEYRFKCKMCDQIYSNEDDLDKHILEHTDYDKTNGISHLIYPNPISSKIVFGYLCSFCYYVQLDYNNMVKHMELRHFDEDKKSNGYWTVIRISMSMTDKNYIDSPIDFDNLVGCLPPIQVDQVISESNDNEDQIQDLNKVSKQTQAQCDFILSIKKEIIEPMNDEISQFLPISKCSPLSVIEDSPSELSIFENPPNLIIDKNSPKLTFDKNPSESNVDINPPESVIGVNHSKSDIDMNSPESIIGINPPESVISVNHPKSDIDVNSPESVIGVNHPKSDIYVNSSELVIDVNPTESVIDVNPVESVIDVNHPESNIEVNPLETNMLKFLPEQAYQYPTNQTRISTEASDIDNFEITLKGNSIKYTLAGLSCELINSMALFKCSILSCSENQFSTVDLNDFHKHINQNHKFVVWDGKCKLCHDNLKLISKKYYIKNALKHLVTHHLVFKNKEQPNHMINPEGLNLNQSLSSTSQDINNTPAMFMKQFANCSVEHNEIENSEQSSHIFGNQCETSVNPDIYHGSNDERVPSLSSSNLNVKSSKKVKGNTYKMNSCVSDSDIEIKTIIELVLPHSEIVLEKGQQIVNNGVPINGIIYLIETDYKKDYDKKVRDLPINVMKTKLAFSEMSILPRLLGLFKCMDRTCTKIFNSKEMFKLHMKLHFSNTEKKKKNQIYNVEQFKMCAYCFKMFDDEESLANHIADKYSFCEYFCPYCFYRAYSASHVLVHQTLIHTKIPKHYTIKLECDYGACDYPKETLFIVDFKKFVLPYKCNVGCCAFSCYLLHEFKDHLNENHQQCDQFCCYICSNKDDAAGYYALQPSVMISHFKLHNLNRYQCIFCLFGSEIINPMIKHLALEHFEYEPLCLERSTVSDDCDSKNIKNLKILRLNKVIENGMIEIINLPADIFSLPEVLPLKSKKRPIECPDALSVAMKSARIEGSQLSDTIVITVPDSAQMGESSTPLSLNIDNEFIMIDDVNQNDMQESLKINRIWSESKNKEKEPKVSSTDDIIVIEDEDDLLEKEELESSTKRTCLEQEESINGSIKVKRVAFPIIELDKLFFCKECEKVFSNGDIYYSHLNVCPSWDSVAGRKCMYCVKVFKTTLNMTEHIKLHGPDRFKCYLCDLNLPSQRAITHHMKHSHKITNIDFVPEHPDLTDLDKDVFIVLENKKIELKEQKINNLLKCIKCPFKGNTNKIIMSHMKAVHNDEENVNCKDISYDKIMQEQPNDTNNLVNSLIPQQNEQQSPSLKRKRSTNFGNQKVPLKEKPITKDKTKNLCFSPDTIDSIPKSHIFSDPISCSLCTYNTKVRSNLVIHLNGHKKGQDNTTKEIVNPVPSIGKSELMFDKMINLSASSFDAMNTEKMKRDELDKKIVEVAPDDNINTEIFPKFIPKNMRYKCSIPLCDYTGLTEERLKTHISVLHSSYECYTCPHCLPPCETSKIVEHLMHHGENLYKCQYCDYIDFNRVEMKTHMRNTHLSEISNSVQSNIIVIRQTLPVDDSFDRGRSKVPSNVPQWICNICSTGLRYTENEITSHILMAHNISNMFKCPMCQFENKDDNPSIFEEHYKSEHPSVAVQCLRVFEMISDKEEWHKPLKGAENFLEQQALESIEPTLVPPTCRGIPVESSPLKMNNKFRGTSKSPKSATKSSSFQPHKQKTLINSFNKNDKLGAISSNGHFVCPKCNVFETINIELFREHLYKEVNYKTWKCLKCFEISDSPKKMAWHVKKHGIGSKYEKIEDGEKLKWVDRVIGHQFFLLTELNKNSKAKHIKSVESCKTVIVNNKRTSNSPNKKKNIECQEKEVLLSQPSSDPASNDDIINLVDDSDNE